LKTAASVTLTAVPKRFPWLVLIILAIILLAWVVHLAGGGIAHIRIGHFILEVGFT
jgi:hypothetical protein